MDYKQDQTATDQMAEPCKAKGKQINTKRGRERETIGYKSAGNKCLAGGGAAEGVGVGRGG